MPGFIFRQLASIVESCIRNIGGGLGQRLRYQWYRNRFASCGIRVIIQEDVIFQNPENMEVGSDVCFLPHSLITAMPKGSCVVNRIVKEVPNPRYEGRPGTIRIGNKVWIGAYNILQGYGGLEIGDKVTTSARVSIYSFSHLPCDESDRTRITYANSMVAPEPISCIRSPVVLEEGVWLGLNVVVFGGTVGRNSFVATNSVVMKDLEENSWAQGSPARKAKNRFEY